MSNMKWKTVKIGDVADICLGKMLDQEKNQGNYMPYLANINVRWGEFDLLNLRRMRFESDELEKFSLKYGDIIMCEGGEPGRCAIWKQHNSNILFQKALHRIRTHECLDSNYLYYVLLLMGKHNSFDPFLTGSTIKHLPSIKLAIIDIPLPPLPIQRKIAAVLTALDDKIALNKRINDKLEAMAKRLYDYWFVQFDFPDENGRPYKSSGGKMVWNETLKREIPEGWEVKPLKQFASYRTDTTKSENAYNYISTDNILPDKQGISDETIYPASGNIFQYKQNDILISNIRPYFKKIWLASYNGTCSTDILCICSNQHEHNSYIYRTLWRDDFFDYVMQGAKGSKMPRGDKEHIMNYPICFHNYLTNVLLKPFNDKCLVIQEMLYRNNNETMRLTALRDRLLPLLMNGQVVVEGEE